MSTVRLRRLEADYDKLCEYINRHPRLQLIQAEGTPPERYQLELRIRGLRQTGDELSVVKSHMIEITLPLSCPRMPPQCRMLSPVFHPNIAPHAICIGDHWSPGEPLWSIIARIGEMIAYQSYNTKSPLNGEAARWVDEHLDELPLDATSMMPDDGRDQAVMAEPRASARAPIIPRSPQHPPSVHAPPTPPVTTPQLPVSTPSPRPPASEADRHFGCPQCGATLRLTPQLAGKQVRCLQCRTVFRVPAS
jgi:ubiquitin-protein ligase